MGYYSLALEDAESEGEMSDEPSHWRRDMISCPSGVSYPSLSSTDSGSGSVDLSIDKPKQDKTKIPTITLLSFHLLSHLDLHVNHE